MPWKKDAFWPSQWLAFLQAQRNSLCDTLMDFQSGSLRDVGSQLRTKFCHVIGEKRDLEACARDGNVGEARVEQVWVDTGVGVNENAFRSKALRAVTGNGIAVVEMTMLDGVKFDLAAVVEACRKPTIRMDGF